MSNLPNEEEIHKKAQRYISYMSAVKDEFLRLAPRYKISQQDYEDNEVVFNKISKNNFFILPSFEIWYDLEPIQKNIILDITYIIGKGYKNLTKAFKGAHRFDVIDYPEYKYDKKSEYIMYYKNFLEKAKKNLGKEKYDLYCIPLQEDNNSPPVYFPNPNYDILEEDVDEEDYRIKQLQKKKYDKLVRNQSYHTSNLVGEQYRKNQNLPKYNNLPPPAYERPPEYPNNKRKNRFMSLFSKNKSKKQSKKQSKENTSGAYYNNESHVGGKLKSISRKKLTKKNL